MYRFAAIRPVRYQAFLLSRFSRAGEVTVVFDPQPSPAAASAAGVEAAPDHAGNRAGAKEFATARRPAVRGPGYSSLDLIVDANPQDLDRGRSLTETAADVARFYQSVIGDSPYRTFTLALIENTLPGGHSPGYFAALNQPLPSSTIAWRSDPANFEGFPEFFLAHEMAHQWWGQAVGWQNYHEQWLSEGFAQYFAGLYARHHRGEQVFTSMLRQWRKWSLDRSDQGPVYLGYRLGHIRNDGRVFSGSSTAAPRCA